MSRGLKTFMLSFIALGFVATNANAEMLPPMAGGPRPVQQPVPQQVGGFMPFMGQPMVTSRTNVRVRVTATQRMAVNPVQQGLPGGPMPVPGGPVPQGMHAGPQGCPPPPCGPAMRPPAQPCGRMACGGGGGCGRGRPCGGARIRGCMRIAGGCGGGVRVAVRVRVGGCFGRGRRC